MMDSVTISVDKYNDLILENARLKSALSIKNSWRDQPELEINLRVLAKEVKELFQASNFTNNFEMVTEDKWYPVNSDSPFVPIVSEVVLNEEEV